MKTLFSPKTTEKSALTDLFTWISVVAVAVVEVEVAVALLAVVVMVAVVVVVFVCVLASMGMRACTRVRGRDHACSLDMCHTIVHASSYRNSMVN
jgi:Flp pilus assembly protein TadB